MMSRRFLTLAGVCAMLCASVPAGFAQQWPARTVKVVVPYGVGGVTDTMARVTADRLGKALNQTFVIENKLGAGGAIGVDYALTVSCYQADEQGRACGRCDSCRLRRDGFAAARVADPTRYRE